MENQKLTQDEITSLKRFEQNQINLLHQLGSIEFNLNVLTTQKQETMSSLNLLEEEQSKSAVELEKKYGQGVINLETGEFIKD